MGILDSLENNPALGEILAQELPKAVDQASPQGRLPHGA